jgi:peptide/nickel transport system substrate-binding protein
LIGVEMIVKRRSRALVLAITLVAAAASCGGDDGGTDTTAGAAVDTTAASGDTTAPSGSAGSTAAPGGAGTSLPATQTDGGSLVYGTYGEGSGFDPIKRGLGYCNPAIYDALLKFDAEGIAQPYMAESMTSTDNLVWTLTLRPGIMFHDDTPLNADAVIFNIERHQDPANASAIAAQAALIASMRKVDDLTVEFTLKSPNAYFPSSFAQAQGLGVILSPTAVQQQGADFNLHPVGAGPFEFVEWIPDDHLTLKKNENYWQPGLPHLDELICRPLPDTQTRYQAIAAGDVDFTYMITAAEIDQAKADSNLVVLDAVGNGGEGIILNDNRPPFDDPRMREAFVRMLNLDAIAEVRFNGNRDIAGAIGLVADSSALYNPAVEEIWPQYDVDKAKELIEAYRAEGGDPNFTFKLPNTPDRRRFGDMAGQFFGDAGLDVQMEYLDISEFVSNVLNGHDFQAAINSHPAAVGLYPQMWNAYHTGGQSNFGDFSDPEIDALLETAVSSTDPAISDQAWKDVQVKIAEAIPFATYGRPPSAIITRPHVAGVDKYPDNTIFFATLSREG